MADVKPERQEFAKFIGTFSCHSSQDAKAKGTEQSYSVQLALPLQMSLPFSQVPSASTTLTATAGSPARTCGRIWT